MLGICVAALRCSRLVEEVSLVSDDCCLSLPQLDASSQRKAFVVAGEVVPTWAKADFGTQLRRSIDALDVLLDAGGEVLPEDSGTFTLLLLLRALGTCASCWNLVQILATSFLSSGESLDNMLNAWNLMSDDMITLGLMGSSLLWAKPCSDFGGPVVKIDIYRFRIGQRVVNPVSLPCCSAGPEFGSGF